MTNYPRIQKAKSFTQARFTKVINKVHWSDKFTVLFQSSVNLKMLKIKKYIKN